MPPPPRTLVSLFAHPMRTPRLKTPMVPRSVTNIRIYSRIVTGTQAEVRGGRAVPASTASQQRVSLRWISSLEGDNRGLSESKTYGFEEIKELISKPSKERILIDTREPSELSTTGHIPTALNIPVATHPDAFFITDDEFEDRFGFARPPKGAEVVFYCKAGVRSRAAAQLARDAGWVNTGEYPGSWVDWEGRGGERTGGQESS